ncbi:HMG box protein, partial [Paraphaeosphaeria sporulosa]
MSDLGERLARLGLSQYLGAFVSEGFDAWETVLDITESDLASLRVKLGHRRKLQRAIAESRGQSSGRSLSIAFGKAGSVDVSCRSGDPATETKARLGKFSASRTPSGAKRKYTRHPKPDEHAPERPPSAYVIFSNRERRPSPLTLP